MSENLTLQDDWVPASCTLPTVEQPLRRAEFDQLFADDVVVVDLVSAHELRLELRAELEVAERAVGLAVKESGCCSFFAFVLSIAEGRVALGVSTTPEHAPVLAALAALANKTGIADMADIAEHAVTATGGQR